MFRGFLRKILKLCLWRGDGENTWPVFSIFADFLMKPPDREGEGGDEYHAPKSWYCFGNLDWLLFGSWKKTLRIPTQFRWQLLNRVRKRSQVWKKTVPTFPFFLSLFSFVFDQVMSPHHFDQMSQVFLIALSLSFLARSSLLVTLIKCVKGTCESLVLLFEGVL